MILFITLAIIAILLLVFTVFAVAVGGAVFIVIFADVIVCAAIIIWIAMRLVKKKKRK